MGMEFENCEVVFVKISNWEMGLVPSHHPPSGPLSLSDVNKVSFKLRLGKVTEASFKFCRSKCCCW